MFRFSSLVFIACAVAATAALGQDDAYVIDAAGTATVDTAPATLLFQIEILPGGGSAVELVQQAEAFENTIRSQLQERALNPSQIGFSGPNYTHPQQLGPNASAYVRFPATPYAVGDDADEKFAKLRDEIAAIAAVANARLHPAKYEVTDPEQVEAAAVARALEKAFLPAKAAADVMGARIISVGNVSVGSVVWSTTDSAPAEYNIRRVTCTVTVSAGYLYVPGP